MINSALCLLSLLSPPHQHVLLGLRFNELSWDHSYPEGEGDSHILWLEFDGEEAGTPVNKLLKIYSKQVGQMFLIHTMVGYQPLVNLVVVDY